MAGPAPFFVPWLASPQLQVHEKESACSESFVAWFKSVFKIGLNPLHACVCCFVLEKGVRP